MDISKNKKERVAVYIDGSNFYGYLKDKEINYPAGVKFNFKTMVDFLVGERICVSKRYYTGVFRNIDKTEKSPHGLWQMSDVLKHPTASK